MLPHIIVRIWIESADLSKIQRRMQTVTGLLQTDIETHKNSGDSFCGFPGVFHCFCGIAFCLLNALLLLAECLAVFV